MGETCAGETKKMSKYYFTGIHSFIPTVTYTVHTRTILS